LPSKRRRQHGLGQNAVVSSIIVPVIVVLSTQSDHCYLVVQPGHHHSAVPAVCRCLVTLVGTSSAVGNKVLLTRRKQWNRLETSLVIGVPNVVVVISSLFGSSHRRSQELIGQDIRSRTDHRLVVRYNREQPE